MEFKTSSLLKFSVASLLFLSGQLLLAQSAGTGALTGTVTDPSGAAIVNANVTLTNNDTNQTRTTATGSDGTYRFNLLPPGNYKVGFSATGFKTAEVPSIAVQVTETPVLDRRLELGAQAEQVTVEANAEVLQTASSTLGTTVNTQEVVGLPLSNRNYTQLLSMSAGANVGVNNATQLGKATQDISVNGADPSSNNYMMDGVSIVNTNNTGSANDSGIYAGIGIPNPDAIQEFKIQTSTYDASYGAHPGGNVNVVTKSGTNEFHGDAWWFIRQTDLNANPFFANSLGSGKEVLNQNQVGGTIGGPIKKNKLFLFGDYQYTGQKNGIASGGSSTQFLFPLPSVRTAANLGAALCPANHPGNPNYLSFLGGLDGAVACDGSNISPVSLAMLNLKLPNGQYYIPSNPNGVYGPVVFSTPAIWNEYQYVINGDYIINDKNTLSTRYFWTHDPQSLPLSGNLPGTPISLFYENVNAVAKLTTLVSSTLVNEFHFSGQYNVAKGHDSTVATPQSIGQATIVPSVTELPVTIILNGPSLNGSLYPDSSPSDQEEIGDQISWAKGKHTIRVGYEFQTTKWPISFAGLERGFLFYGTFADWVMGGPGNILQCLFCVRSGPYPDGIIHDYLEKNHSAFVQDDWKVNNRLTLNLGLRWEYDGTYSDKYGNLTNLWLSQFSTVAVPPTGPTSSGPGLVGYVVPNNYTSHYSNPPSGVLTSNSSLPTSSGVPWDNFAPRIGFAWQPMKEGKLVVRGGFGMFYDRIGGGTFVHGLEQGYPYAVTLDYSGFNTFTNANPYPTTPLGTFASRYANFNGCQPACAAGPTAISGLDSPLLDQTLHTPLTRQYNLTIQYEFVRNWVLEAGFVGSSSNNLLDQYHSVNNPLLASPSNPINGITENTIANASLRVPVLGYLPAGLDETSFDGISNYNSLQVTVRKRFSSGLQMQAAYTWSKDLSDIAESYASGTGANSNYPGAMGQQYGPVNFYHPQRFIINYSYDLPFNHSGGLGRITNGWNVSGVTTVQDGTPLTIGDQNAGTVYDLGSYDLARAQMCPGSTYANIATSGSVTQRLGDYLNAGAFCSAPAAPNAVAAPPGPFGPNPVPTLYGNSGVGVILGPGQFNWDVSIVKTTRIKEKQMLIFRTEFYNTFNHPQFGNPATAISTPSTFGQITTTTVNPRLIQFALKYVF